MFNLKLKTLIALVFALLLFYMPVNAKMSHWALEVSLLSMGAIIYSAINSSGWVLADKSRAAYGIPIWFSLSGSVISCIIILS